MMRNHHGWKAEKVIAEGRTTRCAIDEIRLWLKDNSFSELTDEQIVLFLLSCNNDICATQRTITVYYQVRVNYPTFFNNRDAESGESQQVLRVAYYGTPPNRTADGNIICFHKLRDTTYWRYNIEPSMKVFFMCLEIILRGESPPTGMIFLFDMKGVGLMHLTRVRMNAVRVFFKYLQEGLPIQLREIHVLNVVYFFDKILSIIKPFMKPEVYDMLHLHPPGMEMEEFFEKHVPRDCVPSDYGGTSPSAEELHTNLVETLVDSKRYFDEEQEQRKDYKL